jgi:hypothetical protein
VQPPPPSSQDLQAEILALRARLQEAQETLDAIRTGSVDAVVVSGAQGNQIFTLQGADTAYRVLVESMQEGAVTVAADGTSCMPINGWQTCCRRRLSAYLARLSSSLFLPWTALCSPDF